MESVYKLSKYSQKIGEACRAKQLNKVMEYNKHELAYINKLSKYFNNQKGGASVEDVLEVIQHLIGEIKEKHEREMMSKLKELEQTNEQQLQQLEQQYKNKIINAELDERAMFSRMKVVEREEQLWLIEKDKLEEKIQIQTQELAQVKEELAQVKEELANSLQRLQEQVSSTLGGSKRRN